MRLILQGNSNGLKSTGTYNALPTFINHHLVWIPMFITYLKLFTIL